MITLPAHLRRIPIEAWFLALPLLAIANAVVMTICTLIGVRLTLLDSLLGLCVIGLCALPFLRIPRTAPTTEPDRTPLFLGTWGRTLKMLCILLLTITGLFSFTHAAILPTYQIDSLTNWTMRSKISFVDQRIAFDATEERGMAKPQYPILFHGLQILANEVRGSWSDRWANTVLWLLSLSTIGAIAVLMRKLRSADHALLAVTLVCTTPLIAFHLAQGYADIHLTGYLCLSVLCLLLSDGGLRRGPLVLSALFAAGAAWTKSEGTIIGILPWVLLVLPFMLRKEARTNVLLSVTACIITIAPFYVLLSTLHLGLTPHSTDALIACKTSAIPLTIGGLFSGGSFGVTWYGLLVAIPLIACGITKADTRIDPRAAYTFLWGGLVLAIVLFTYVCTPNEQFLEHGQSYYRQLMTPAALLLLSCVASLRRWR